MFILSISAVAVIALSTIASADAQPASSALPQLLKHRHSFISSLPVEPSDENLRVKTHQVEVVGLTGFREWEVKGSVAAFSAATGKAILELGPAINGSTKVHVQWYNSKAPLLRPPFTATFIPGFHLAVTSNDFAATWKEYCPVLVKFIGAMDCQDHEENTLEEQSTKPISLRHLTPIRNHYYVHRTLEPTGFLSPSSAVSNLLAKQQQLQDASLSDSPPALIDLVIQNGNVNLKVVWPVDGSNGQESNVKIHFNEKTDKVVEVGWFYRELTEKEHTTYDHYLGATVKMDARGEVVSEALIQARSPVFPPHKREVSTGKIRVPGHGYTSTMTPPRTFHPHSVTTIHSHPYIASTTSNCQLLVLQLLPPGVFVDPFQLQGLAPEIGDATVFGETDLEKPVGVVPGWGSLVMVKVQPEDSVKTSRWIAGNTTDHERSAKGDKNANLTSSHTYTSTVDIPMHMRYQPPVSKDDPATHVEVAVPWPLVVWACPLSTEGEDPSTLAAKKLFHIPPLPLNLLFSAEDSQGQTETVNFRSLLPDPVPKQYPESHVSVPVGRLDDLSLVRTATFAMAGMGSLAVACALAKTVMGRSAGKGKRD